MFCKSGLMAEPKDIVNAEGLIFGQSSPAKALGYMFVFTKELLGVKKVKEVWGYTGSGPARLAFLKGEINWGISSSAGYGGNIKPLVEKGEAMAICQSGRLDAEGNIIRSPVTPEIPTVFELYQQIYGKAPSGPAWEAVRLGIGIRTHTRTLLFGPGVSSERVDTLSKAATDMVKDPAFLKDVERIMPGASHIVGKELARAFKPSIGASREVVEFAKEYLSREYGLVYE